MAQTTTKENGNGDGNKPIRVFRAFGVKVSVFENRTTKDNVELVFHKVSLQRIYREGEEYKTTTSLGRHDLPAAWMLLQKAWDFISQAESGRNGKEAMA